jgi:insulysin
MLESLAKQDLIEFYNHYISPASTKRAKLAIHMVANTDNTGKSQVGPLPLAEQRSLSIQVVDKVLNQLSIKSDLDILNSKFAQLEDLTVDNTCSTLRSYLESLEPTLDKHKLNEAIATAEPFLKDLLKPGKETPATATVATNGDAEKSTVESIVQKGQAGIGALLNTLGVQGGSPSTKREGVIIEDVASWKAGMELSSAPSPVKPLVLYEELNVKL